MAKSATTKIPTYKRKRSGGGGFFRKIVKFFVWLFILSIYASACVLTQRGQNRTLMPWVSAVLLANASFFLVLLVFVTDPFERLPHAAVLSDGAGLNPLLQHPVMMIHPLMLYTGLVGFVIPTRELEWLCFALSWWLAGHAALLFAFRQWNMPDGDRRRMHRRAGLAFGGFFLVYQALFLLFWLDGGQRLAPWVAPPALVFCLLAALVATVHGFLEYHFRRWYVLVVLALLVVIGLVNGRPRYKLPGPSGS